MAASGDEDEQDEDGSMMAAVMDAAVLSDLTQESTDDERGEQ